MTTFGPMILGYALGALGVYTLLFRLAPFAKVEASANASRTETIVLFEETTQAKAA